MSDHYSIILLLAPVGPCRGTQQCRAIMSVHLSQPLAGAS